VRRASGPPPKLYQWLSTRARGLQGSRAYVLKGSRAEGLAAMGPLLPASLAARPPCCPPPLLPASLAARCQPQPPRAHPPRAHTAAPTKGPQHGLPAPRALTKGPPHALPPKARTKGPYQWLSTREGSRHGLVGSRVRGRQCSKAQGLEGWQRRERAAEGSHQGAERGRETPHLSPSRVPRRPRRRQCPSPPIPRPLPVPPLPLPHPPLPLHPARPPPPHRLPALPQDVSVLDARTTIAGEPGSTGYDAYLEGHVPGSVHWNLKRDGTTATGAASLLLECDAGAFAAGVERKGVSVERPVVVRARWGGRGERGGQGVGRSEGSGGWRAGNETRLGNWTLP
jgi:hypothetical protein